MTDLTVFAPGQEAVIYDSDLAIPVYVGPDVGPAGAQGPQGPQGIQGIQGVAGKTVLNGTVPPTSQGVVGDFYIDTTADSIYGPKTAGGWGSPTSLIGPQGIQGIQGIQGVKGDTGAQGPRGYSVLNGAGAPTAGIGIDGDFFINTTADSIYGPKTAGAWGAPTSLIGPQGPTGATGAASTVPGPQGIQGPRGYSVLNGAGAPAAGAGIDGDFFIDTNADSIYGPKTAGAWGPPTSLIGPEGDQGIQGPQGPQGLPGAGSTSDLVYGPTWNGIGNISPSQNAVFDKIESILDGETFTGAVVVPDQIYQVAWNGNFEVPTKNAIYDKIESVIAGAGSVSNDVYGAAWNGVTTISPSQNAVYDQIELLYPKTGGVLSGNINITAASAAITLNPASGISTIDLRGTASTADGLSLRASGATVSFCADTTLFRNRAASVTFGTLNSTSLTMTVPVVVPDSAYALGWNGSFEVPTKNAIYDQMEILNTALVGKANTSALANYLPLTGGALTGDLAINKASPQFTLNPASGGSVVELLGAGGVNGMRLQAIAAAGYVRADTVTITNKADSATYAVFNTTGLNVTGTITTTGVITGGQVNSTGSITAASTVYAVGYDASGAILSRGSSGTFAGANVGAGIESRSSDAVSGSTGAWLAFHRPSAMAMHIGLDIDGQFKIGGWSWGYTPALTLTSTGVLQVPSTIWLNADKLLLQHSSGNGYIRTQAGGGHLYLGANSATILTLTSSGLAQYATHSPGDNSTNLATTAFVNQTLRPTVASASTSFTAADTDNNAHKVLSGASRALTLNSTPATGTAFTARFTTAWTITCTSLSKNGAAPVANGSVAANSLITFLHEGAGTWVASGSGLT